MRVLGEPKLFRIVYSSYEKEANENKTAHGRLRTNPLKLVPGMFSLIPSLNPQARRVSSHLLNNGSQLIRVFSFQGSPAMFTTLH